MPDSQPDSLAAAQWRQQVLDASVRVMSWIVPTVTLALMVSRDRAYVDLGTVTLVVLSVLVLGLRFRPQLGFRWRAGLLLAALEVGAVLTLAHSGLLPGPALAGLSAVVLAAIFFGRRTMVLVLCITPLAYVVIGLLFTRGALQLRFDDADPMAFGHWLRVANTTALLSALLGVAVEYVLRQVETNYRSALDSTRELRVAYDQLGMLHRQLELTKEQERAFLARELHDEMGQTLTVLKLRLQLHARSAGPAASAQTHELLSLVDGLITHVRKISLDLRPTLLDELGLEAALSAFIDTQARHSGVEMTLHVDGLQERLSPELEHACFRVVQEAVTNAMRHAQAQRVQVRVARVEQRVRIQIEDDGHGFTAQEAAAKAGAGHLGLVGMRERVRLLGGELELSHAHGGSGAHLGTLVQAWLPVAVT